MLVGLEIFSQFLVLDHGAKSGLSATDGLQVTFQKGPLVVGVGYNTFVAYNPATQSLKSMGGITGPFGAQFNRKGDLLLLADRNYMLIFDANASPMRKIATVYTPGGDENHIIVHPNDKLAYTSVASNTTPAVYVIDIDRSSSKFGTILGTVKGFPGGAQMFEGGSISANGKVMCICTIGLGGPRNIYVIDTDPSSPKFNTVKNSFPVSSIGGYMTDVEVGPNGIYAYICFSTISKSSDYARIHLKTGQVLNHLRMGNNALFPTDIDLDPRGRFLIVSCPNSYNLLRIDLAPGPNFFKGTVFQGIPRKPPFSVALTPDGSTAWAMTMGSGLYAWDTSTGKLVKSVPLRKNGAAVAVR